MVVLLTQPLPFCRKNLQDEQPVSFRCLQPSRIVGNSATGLQSHTSILTSHKSFPRNGFSSEVSLLPYCDLAASSLPFFLYLYSLAKAWDMCFQQLVS